MTRLCALLLLSSCTLSHDVAPCGVLTVETTDLSPPQQELVAEAVERWNAVGFEVLRQVERDGDILVSGEEPDDGAYILSTGPVIAIGWHHDDGAYPLEHELGHQLGLPDDDYAFSIMHPGPAPYALVLPQHAALLRERVLRECGGLTMTVEAGGGL
jgi:hypothetical protein